MPATQEVVRPLGGHSSRFSVLSEFVNSDCTLCIILREKPSSFLVLQWLQADHGWAWLCPLLQMPSVRAPDLCPDARSFPSAVLGGMGGGRTGARCQTGAAVHRG